MTPSNDTINASPSASPAPRLLSEDPYVRRVWTVASPGRSLPADTPKMDWLMGLGRESTSSEPEAIVPQPVNAQPDLAGERAVLTAAFDLDQGRARMRAARGTVDASDEAPAPSTPKRARR